MSFLAPKQDMGPLTDNTPGRQSNSSPNQVIPLILGRGRAVLQWRTPTLRWKFRTTKTSSIAFFTCYADVCLGPIDEACNLLANDQLYHGIFEKRSDNPGTDYVDLTISKETPERFRIWWGNEDTGNPSSFIQSVLDPKLVPDLVGAPHSWGKGVCRILVQDMEAGAVGPNGNTPPLPKVELEFVRYASK